MQSVVIRCLDLKDFFIFSMDLGIDMPWRMENDKDRNSHFYIERENCESPHANGYQILPDAIFFASRYSVSISLKVVYAVASSA